jgi:hypothetical protein
MPRRTRRNASTIGGATPTMTIGRAAAGQAGARRYLHTPSDSRHWNRIANEVSFAEAFVSEEGQTNRGGSSDR